MVKIFEMTMESTHTRLESLLHRCFELGQKKIQVVGGSSPLLLSFFLSQANSNLINDLPHLIVFPEESDCLRFQQLLQVFDPNRESFVLPHFDVSIYSGLYPSPNPIWQRLQFLHRAQKAQGGEIFLATSLGLGQKTLPYKLMSQLSQRWQKGDEVGENIHLRLAELGYESAPVVEDRGQFAARGGILDIFSPAQDFPIRIELFGDQIESFRPFDPVTQRSHEPVDHFDLIPAREVLFREEHYEKIVQNVRSSFEGRKIDAHEKDELIRQIVQKTYFPGIEFLLPEFYERGDSPLEFFSSGVNLWILDPLNLTQKNDEVFAEFKNDFRNSENALIRPSLEAFYSSFENLEWPEDSKRIEFSHLEFFGSQEGVEPPLEYRTHNTTDLSNISLTSPLGSETWLKSVAYKLQVWKEDSYRIFVALKNTAHLERIKHLFERMDFQVRLVDSKEARWDSWLIEQDQNRNLIHIIPRFLQESLRLDEERIVFLREDDFFGKKDRLRSPRGAEDFQNQAKRLSFGDLKPGDLVVHVKHGIGQYEGLKMMNIQGIESEYIQVSYKDKDRLYLPVYRVGQLQKYVGGSNTTVLDRLGGVGWEKTKTKVKSHLREVAHDLLLLYAKRAEIHRPRFQFSDDEILEFDKGFPYEETDDQLRAIEDIVKDMSSTKPMDRLICGDVGFGKTEVAMRAAFFAIQNKKQVAVLAPTTVLTFQHFETFKKRFQNWPIEIQVINRFISNAEAKKILTRLREGQVNLIIGTHRLLSKDVQFKDLGLLIVDEEQKFGVTHKEKIKKMRTTVDLVTLSATPIPRTLNMSLVGIRDLSFINTAPVDRLPTRTFICKFDPETIRKAIESEIHRGGQVYFIHNRIQSIYGLADEIRQIVPQARIRVAHGQMEEEELEKTMLAFFHHEIDVLICTAIVESGMDVPRANTMFIDQAHLFGLSQLYQLRGRVGRSKQRAYCYLILPRQRQLDKDAQERLKVIQENTALGSGIKIAQHDLELRGAGSILGEEQSGHVSSVGYELYMDLLNETLHEAKGEALEDLELDPEINLRIPALIPESYIGDIRIRLTYYKALAEIKSDADLERIEEELKDQFGNLPEPVVNLMGLMLIRRQCKDLGVKDVSAGVKNISLVFSEKTKLSTETIIRLATRENKKYSITPDNRLNVRMNTITWSAVYEELSQLLRL